jgi:FKBP-type peptidyl-prolyl cis-trans isomerase
MVKLALLSLLPMIFAKDQLKIGKIKSFDCDTRTAAGDQLSMHYRGTLLEGGKQFDASYDRGQEFTFGLGAGQVIKGWDQGLQKMCPGDHRKLTIPPHLGYGERGAGRDIPPNAWLVFEVECVSFTRKGKKYTVADNNEEKEEDEGKNEL